MALTTGTISADFTLVIGGVESTDLQGYADLVPSKVQVFDGPASYIVEKLRCPVVDGVLRNVEDTADNIDVTSYAHGVSWRMHVEIPGYILDDRVFRVGAGATMDYVDAEGAPIVATPTVYAQIAYDTDGAPYLVTNDYGSVAYDTDGVPYLVF